MKANIKAAQGRSIQANDRERQPWSKGRDLPSCRAVFLSSTSDTPLPGCFLYKFILRSSRLFLSCRHFTSFHAIAVCFGALYVSACVCDLWMQVQVQCMLLRFFITPLRADARPVPVILYPCSNRASPLQLYLQNTTKGRRIGLRPNVNSQLAFCLG